MKIWLEMEIGITGGEEDGVDNTSVAKENLYTKPEQVWNVYKSLSAVGPMFSIAAAFGNVHGVYKAGNVVLSPHLLAGHQEHIAKQLKTDQAKPAFLVMHGGSGSTQEEIRTAVKNGVIKMNIDTDTQWAYWDGLRKFYKKNEGYLQVSGSFKKTSGKESTCMSHFRDKLAIPKVKTSPTRSSTILAYGSGLQRRA